MIQHPYFMSPVIENIFFHKEYLINIQLHFKNSNTLCFELNFYHQLVAECYNETNQLIFKINSLKEQNNIELEDFSEGQHSLIIKNQQSVILFKTAFLKPS